MSDLHLMNDSISFLIASICKKHRSLAQDLLQKHHGLHVGQEMVLNYLWQKDGQSQSELISKMEVQQATLTKSIKRMEEQGLVLRRKDPSDNRVSNVYLTEKGKQINKNILNTWQTLEDITINGLSHPELEALKVLLLKMKNNLN